MHVLSICTGFGLAGLGRRYKMVIYSLYLINPLIPPMLVLLPQFLIMQSFLTRLPDSARPVGQMLAIVLIYIKGGALPIMVYTSAISAIPRELEESAEIDGANRVQYLTHVILPLLKVPIQLVANSKREFPQKWIAPCRTDVTDEYVNYARPLIGEDMVTVPLVDGLQRFARLKPIFVEKKLPEYFPMNYR